MAQDKVIKSIENAISDLQELKYDLEHDNPYVGKMHYFIQAFLDRTFSTKLSYNTKLELFSLFDDLDYVITFDGDEYYSFGLKDKKFRQMCEKIREELGLELE